MLYVHAVAVCFVCMFILNAVFSYSVLLLILPLRVFDFLLLVENRFAYALRAGLVSSLWSVGFARSRRAVWFAFI